MASTTALASAGAVGAAGRRNSTVFMVIGEYPSPLPHLTCDQDPRHASAWALDGDWTVWTRGSIVPRGLGGSDAEAVMSPPVG